MNDLVNAIRNGTTVLKKKKYLREKTDYYERFYGDTCPSYSPDSQDDPYPGQPFVESREQSLQQNLYKPQPKPQQNYGYDQHQYDKINYNNNQHATRRQEDTRAQDGTNCRVYSGTKGERVRCDRNIEIRDADYEEVRNVNAVPYDPCAVGQDTSGLCFDDDEK